MRAAIVALALLAVVAAATQRPLRGYEGQCHACVSPHMGRAWYCVTDNTCWREPGCGWSACGSQPRHSGCVGATNDCDAAQRATPAPPRGKLSSVHLAISFALLGMLFGACGGFFAASPKLMMRWLGLGFFVLVVAALSVLYGSPGCFMLIGGAIVAGAGAFFGRRALCLPAKHRSRSRAAADGGAAPSSRGGAAGAGAAAREAEADDGDRLVAAPAIATGAALTPGPKDLYAASKRKLDPPAAARAAAAGGADDDDGEEMRAIVAAAAVDRRRREANDEDEEGRRAAPAA